MENFLLCRFCLFLIRVRGLHFWGEGGRVTSDGQAKGSPGDRSRDLQCCLRPAAKAAPSGSAPDRQPGSRMLPRVEPQRGTPWNGDWSP